MTAHAVHLRASDAANAMIAGVYELECRHGIPAELVDRQVKLNLAPLRDLYPFVRDRQPPQAVGAFV